MKFIKYSILLIFIVIILFGLQKQFHLFEKTNKVVDNSQSIELSDDVIKSIGGEEKAREIVKEYQTNKNLLEDSKKEYEQSGKDEMKKPSIIYFIQAAKYAQYLKMYDESLNILNDVFNYYDQSDVALINRAHLYEEIGESQKAIDTYLEIYQNFDVSPNFHKDIIYNYMKLGNKDMIRKYYNEYKNLGMVSEEIEQYLNN